LLLQLDECDIHLTMMSAVST